MGLDWNVQPHECQWSEDGVKEQAPLVVLKWTIEIERGDEEIDRGGN